MVSLRRNNIENDCEILYNIYDTLQICIFYTSYSAFMYHLLFESEKNLNLITAISLNINITLV